MWAKIITIKRTKDLNYFSLCALHLFNTRVSQFELNYWNKWTFPRHSNLLKCTYVYIYIYTLNVLLYVGQARLAPIILQSFQSKMAAATIMSWAQLLQWWVLLSFASWASILFGVTSQWGHKHTNNISRTALRVTSWAFHRFIWVKLSSYHIHTET